MSATTRRALVTGGASGIGLACARRLVADGLSVAIADIDEAELAVVAGETSSTHLLDVADATAVNDLAAALQPIDVLVNSAGITGPNVPVWEVDDAGWARIVAVNLTGTLNTMRAVIPGMRERAWGRIVNIASIAGKEGNPNLGPYSATKAGVIGLTKSAGKELATDGVIVNAIAPAVIASPMLDGVGQETIDYMVSKIPMGRVGTPEEVAALASWLASDECSFSTGHTYDISGGRATY